MQLTEHQDQDRGAQRTPLQFVNWAKAQLVARAPELWYQIFIDTGVGMCYRKDLIQNSFNPQNTITPSSWFTAYR